MKTLLILVLCSGSFLAFCQNGDASIFRQVDSLIEVGTNLTNTRKAKEALPIFTTALYLSKSRLGSEHVKTAQCLYQLGRCHYFIGDDKAAEPFVLEAKVIWDKMLPKDHPDQAKSRNLLAVIYSDRNQNEEATALYMEAKQIWGKSLGVTHENYLGVLVNLGILYVDLCQYNAAAVLLLEAKNTFETVLNNVNHRYYLTCMNNLGRVYMNLGDYESAEAIYLQLIAHREANEDKKNPTYSAALNNLAVMYEKIGLYAKAETYHLRSIAAKKEESRIDKPNIAGIYINLGIMQLAVKKYQEAEVNLLEGKRLFEVEIGTTEHPNYASCLDYLGDLMRSKNRIEEARRYYLQSGMVREKMLGKEHPDLAYNLERLAILDHELRAYPSAEACYLQALALHEKYIGSNSLETANIKHHLSEFYWETGRFEAARQMLMSSDVIYRNVLTRATRHLSIKDLASFQQLFGEHCDLGYSMTQAMSQNMADFSIHAYDQALFYKGFLQMASQCLRQLAEGRPDAQEKLDLLKSFHRQLANAYTLPLAERPATAALEAKADELEKDLSRMVSGFGDAFRQVNWQAVRGALKPGEVAIEFIHYRLQNPFPSNNLMYAALVLRPGDQYPVWVSLFEEKQLRALLGNQESATAASINQLYGSKTLYKLIWAPLEKWLTGVSQIYYSPSGLLHFLSMDAVMPASAGIYLHRVVSTRELIEKRPEPTIANAYAVVYGGIQYDMDSVGIKRSNLPLNYEMGSSASSRHLGYFSNYSRGIPWQHLQSSEIEARNVSSLLQGVGMRVTLRQGLAATEESVYALYRNSPPPKVVHFSTHGFSFPDPITSEKEPRRTVDPKDPILKQIDSPMLRSGLIMAGANQVWTGGKAGKGLEDGILTAYEVSQLNLKGTELVVLSACETGLGKIQGNEGIYGLQRAFKIAGARYLLMSLWQVPDHQTEALMNAFYLEWLKGKKSIPSAFKSAQMRLQAQYQQPFYWAGFILLE